MVPRDWALANVDKSKKLRTKPAKCFTHQKSPTFEPEPEFFICLHRGIKENFGELFKTAESSCHASLGWVNTTVDTGRRFIVHIA
jgi:hypothetical protein